MQSVGYFLVSNSNKKQIKSQIKSDFEEYCEFNGHTPIHIYTDNNSTRLTMFSEFERLKHDIKVNNNKYLILINNSSDLGRDIIEIVRNLLWFDFYQCKVLCMNEVTPDPYQDTVNRYISNNISDNNWSSFVTSKMKDKFLTGKWLGRVPYGYDINDLGYLTPNPTEKKVVGSIFDYYINKNYGIRKITAFLNQKKYKTKKNNLWSISTLYDLLKNPVYIGTVKRFGVSIPNSHNPIIKNTVFLDVQKKLYSRSPIRTGINPEKYKLSGLLYCEFCNSKMIGVTKKIKWSNINSKFKEMNYRYYKCGGRQNNGSCVANSIPAKNMENKFYEQFDNDIKNHKIDINKKLTKIVKKIEMKRNAALINAKNLLVSALNNTAQGKFDVSILRLYLNKYEKLLESEHKNIDKDLILSNNDFKLNLINKIYVSDSNYKIIYERAS